MKNQKEFFSFITVKGDELDFYFDRSYFIKENSILWLKEDSSDVYYIGLDFFTLYDSGSILNLSTRSIGSIIDVNKALVRIETSKPGCCGGLIMKTLTIPWQVEILEINNSLKENLSILFVDPFNNGWIYKIIIITPPFEFSNQNNPLNGVFVSATKPDLMKKEIRNLLRKNKVISFGDY